MKQKIINALSGVAIGDAFGVGIEFKSRMWIHENVHFDRFLNEWKGGVNNILPGTYSDDTEHTLGLVEALLSDEEFSKELLLEKFLHEYETDKARKGYPRDGHGSIEDWYTGKKTIDEVRESQSNREDPGNAPVMRSVPLAFVKVSNMYDYAIINAASTHANIMGSKASILTALTGFYFLREGGEPSGLIHFLCSHLSGGETVDLLKKLDTLPAPNELSEDDYLFLHGEQPLPYIKWDKNVYGLPCAAMKTALNVVYVLKHSTSAFEALKNSINMGGDVDSLAAVCTGIATGKYGMESLPSFLLKQTEGLERIKMLGEKLYEKFSAEYE